MSCRRFDRSTIPKLPGTTEDCSREQSTTATLKLEVWPSDTSMLQKIFFNGQDWNKATQADDGSPTGKR